jgi:hypothetical protein
MISNNTTPTSLGELIAYLFEEYMSFYDNKQLASLAVTARVNELFEEQADSLRRTLRE